jgi:hypothetical protein
VTAVGRGVHRQLDREFTRAADRDGHRDGGDDAQADIARPQRWQGDPRARGRPPMQRQPRVLLAQLSIRTSANGKAYLSGWLGKAKVLGFKDTERDKYGNEVW